MLQQKIRDKFEAEHGFELFLKLAWRALGLPEPTRVQLDIAYSIQHCDTRQIIQAFRGIGKSYITSAYVVYRLLLNPDVKILVVSASKVRSDDFSTFVFQLLEVLGPLTAHLKPQEGQRSSKIAFDVGPAKPAHSPSVTSKGITSQLAGSRADLIIADDVEVWSNSLTAGMREKTLAAVAEFDSILIPKPESKIIFLGTPQCEDTLYNKLRQQSYDLCVWPARIPENPKQYGGALAPFITELAEDNPPGTPTDPDRFDEEELYSRELSIGPSVFQLQFQLNTELSDLDRYPLKLSDIVIMDLDSHSVPEKVNYSSDPKYIIEDIMCIGLGSDRFYRPMVVSEQFLPPKYKVMSIDPAGRGSDETSYSVVSVLNGQYFVHEINGLQGGYEDETLDKLLDIAQKHDVKEIVIESNFGDGAVTKLLEKRIILRQAGIRLTEQRAFAQKEKRIIDTLEPLFASHKVIFDKKALEHDLATTKIYAKEKQRFYSVQYQISRISRDKGSLTHDDRIDALQLAVGALIEFAKQDADVEIGKRQQKEFDDRVKQFLNRATFARKSPAPKRPTW